MNKKGQVLVAFILMLPILIMFSGLLIDIGYSFIEKRNIDNNIKSTIKYSLNNLDLDTNVLENKIKKILNLNIKNIKNLEVTIINDKIDIKLKTTKKSIFYSKEYKIESHYSGYKNNEKITLRKV